VNSILSFFRRLIELLRGEPPIEPAPPEMPMPAAPGVPMARALMTNSAPLLDQVISDMLSALSSYLPAPAPPLPAPTVSVVSVTERTVGLGNRRGNETRGSLAVIALKGGRLDAVVRFQLWANDPGDVDTAIAQLHGRLLAARDALWTAGFLRVDAEGASLAEHVSSLNAWRKTTNYRVLYEFRYEDTDGAESLIARIPIKIDSEYGESTVVTDEMIRWDNQAAPLLEISGGAHGVFRIGAVSILAFLPDGWNGSEVTVSASVGGVVHERGFASVREFLGAFTLETKTVELGGNPYRAGRLVFPNADFPDPIILKGGGDVFRIHYADERFLSENENETDAVVYLRVLS